MRPQQGTRSHSRNIILERFALWLEGSNYGVHHPMQVGFLLTTLRQLHFHPICRVLQTGEQVCLFKHQII